MRIIVVVLLLSALAMAAPAGSPVNGDWDSVITVRDINLRLALHVTDTGKGLKATFDSIDQQVMGMIVDRVEFKGQKFEFDLNVIMAKYTGVLQPDGKTIKGSWEQLGMSFPVNFKKAAPAVSK